MIKAVPSPLQFPSIGGRREGEQKFNYLNSKKIKKCLTSFFRSGIELKNFNFIVLFLHKFKEERR
jgi:hypothetical protein